MRITAALVVWCAVAGAGEPTAVDEHIVYAPDRLSPTASIAGLKRKSFAALLKGAL